MERIDKDIWFLEIAEIVAKRATCPRASVGSLVVRNSRIISMGYNGAPVDSDHCLDYGCVEDLEGGCTRAVHSEVNSLMFAAREGIATYSGTLYSTHCPCLGCSKLIINAGISRVVYEHSYRDLRGVAILLDAGIEVMQVVRGENPKKINIHLGAEARGKKKEASLREAMEKAIETKAFGSGNPVAILGPQDITEEIREEPKLSDIY